MFNDNFHPGEIGRYLIAMTWYAAFYRESPEGKVMPIKSELSPEQALILQRLAWDVVKNYPYCGLYEEGTTPVAAPKFSIAPSTGDKVTSVTLNSSTPGAWFRYTLDGTVQHVPPAISTVA